MSEDGRYMLLLLLIYSLLACPSILLILTWNRLLRGSRVRHDVTIAALISFCYLWLLAAIPFKRTLLGEDYSQQLYLKVQIAFGFSILLFLIAAVRRSSARALLAGSALATSLGWAYVGAIN